MGRWARRRLRSAAFRVIETYWTAWFTAVGVAWRPRAAERSPGGGERVLVVAAHPDDETIGCGGTIASHVFAGDDVCVAVVTDGGSSGAFGLTRDEMRGVRAREAAAAAAELGVTDLVLFGACEGMWSERDVAPGVVRLLERTRPTIVYTLSGVDFHPEHIRVARLLAHALAARDPGTGPVVRVYEAQVPLTPLLANTAVITRAVDGRHARAIARYRSQSAEVERRARTARYRRAIHRTPHDIEVFWEMTPDAFVAVMDRAGDAPPVFRGTRPRPMTDPLAWIVGARERRRLARRVARWDQGARPR